MTLKNHCMFDKVSYNVSPIYISNSENIPKSKKLEVWFILDLEGKEQNMQDMMRQNKIILHFILIIKVPQ